MRKYAGVILADSNGRFSLDVEIFDCNYNETKTKKEVKNV